MNKCILILLAIFLISSSQVSELEREILELRKTEEIKLYWENLKEMDQKFRGKETLEINDNTNFKKMILMIKYHGYPSKLKFGYDINITPNLIFTHQESDYVREKYFPIFYNELLEGKCDTTWFLNNLQGILRSKFGRDFIRGRELEFDDIKLLLDRIGFNNEKSTFDLGQFDSLFENYKLEVNKIKSGEVIGKWSKNRKGSYWLIKFDKKMYIYREYNDGSYKFPQKLKYNEKEMKYTYFDNIGFEDEFRIDNNGNLVVTIDKRDLNKMISFELEISENGDSTYNRVEKFMDKEITFIKQK